MRSSTPFTSSLRTHCWDELNRLQGFSDSKYDACFLYDGSGERFYKFSGMPQSMMVNGQWSTYHSLTDPTLYASPYLVATPKGYTKHYYAENERVASKVGGGGLQGLHSGCVSPVDFAAKVDSSQSHLQRIADCLGIEISYMKTNALVTLDLLHDEDNNPLPESECYWYHPDHLGSASWVSDKAGKGIQYLYYLPWGEELANQRATGYESRYTFSGKERDEETGYSYFGARHYHPTLSIWLSVDPMSDKYPGVSPYTYCGNNPVRLVDPDGREIGDFIADGVIIGNDGKKDGKLYVVNNQSLSSQKYREVKKFIKDNSGNTKAFEENSIAYNNSTEIEGSVENRQAMIDIVSQDNGEGGSAPANNREYGGKYDENGKIIPLPPGEIGDLTKNTKLLFDSENIFHSHASGTWTTPINLNNFSTILGGTTEKKRWTQEPSQEDIDNCGDRIRYVFGMGNKTVYVYTKDGIQATIPMGLFVHPYKK